VNAAFFEPSPFFSGIFLNPEEVLLGTARGANFPALWFNFFSFEHAFF